MASEASTTNGGGATRGVRVSVDEAGASERDVLAWLARRFVVTTVQREAIPGVPARRDERALPIVLAPRTSDASGARVASLIDAIDAERETIDRALDVHGAVLFRGFDVHDAPDFQSVAQRLSPALGSSYRGTSPRVGLTDRVFTASELPSFYPIPQHLEMSFLPSAPSRLYFAALEPNASVGGETPLTDFRAVWRDLAPEVRERFASRGLRIVRNYAGPKTPRGIDPWGLKRWDELFGTTDRAEVERRAAADHLAVRWLDGDRLRLESRQPAVRTHPITGELVWSNHAQVFHPSAAAGEYERIAALRGQRRYRVLARVADALTRITARLRDPDALAMTCSYGDGSPIPRADMDAVRDAIWRNLVVYRWKRGDVLALDNRAIAHGRLPYTAFPTTGPRLIAVAWS